jgi:MFS family permease
VASPSAQPTARSLWRHPDFLKFWSAETISQFGTQISLLALPLIAINFLEATPFEVALLGTIEFLPFILFSLPAGAWIDRLRRRPILIAGDLGRAIALGSIPVAFALDGLTIWQLYVVGFAVGVLTVFFDVSYQAYVPSLVDRDQLIEANSKLEISRTVAQTAGTAIAGGIIQLVRAPMAILIDAISFLGSGLFVLLIRRPEPTPDRRFDEHGQPRGSMRSEVAAGLRYVLGNRYLRGIAASTGISNLFTNIGFATLLVFLVRELGLEAGAIGLAFGLGNVGAIVGALTATRISRVVGVGPAIVLSVAIGAPALFLVALAPVDTAFPFLVAAGMLTGFSAVVYNVNQVSFRQAITPERMQGRMHATMRFIVWGTIPVGQILGGFIAQALTDAGLGLRPVILLGGIGAASAVLPVLLTPVRTIREMPTGPEDVGEPAHDHPGPAEPVTVESDGPGR